MDYYLQDAHSTCSHT